MCFCCCFQCKFSRFACFFACLFVVDVFMVSAFAVVFSVNSLALPVLFHVSFIYHFSFRCCCPRKLSPFPVDRVQTVFLRVFFVINLSFLFSLVSFLDLSFP